MNKRYNNEGKKTSLLAATAVAAIFVLKSAGGLAILVFTGSGLPVAEFL